MEYIKKVCGFTSVCFLLVNTRGFGADKALFAKTIRSNIVAILVENPNACNVRRAFDFSLRQEFVCTKSIGITTPNKFSLMEII